MIDNPSRIFTETLKWDDRIFSRLVTMNLLLALMNDTESVRSSEQASFLTTHDIDQIASWPD